jgi:hypothetical protein
MMNTVEQKIKEQDNQVEEIHDIVKRLKVNSNIINNTLDDHKM